MGDRSAQQTRLIEWGVASQSLDRDAGSGDCYVVKPIQSGVLLAVIDGLGHGEQAAEAARLASAAVNEYAQGSIISIFSRAHERLKGTRGAVMTLALFNASANTLTWAGVGNVEGLLLRRGSGSEIHADSLMLGSGVIGDQIPHVIAFTKRISNGDTVIVSTDGIRNGFDDGLNLFSSPQHVADSILASHSRNDDDALVVVTRYVGSQ